MYMYFAYNSSHFQITNRSFENIDSKFFCFVFFIYLFIYSCVYRMCSVQMHNWIFGPDQAEMNLLFEASLHTLFQKTKYERMEDLTRSQIFSLGRRANGSLHIENYHDICDKRRSRLACVSTQVNLGHHCSPIECLKNMLMLVTSVDSDQCRF